MEMSEAAHARLFRLWQRGTTPRAAAKLLLADFGVETSPEAVRMRFVGWSWRY